MADVTHTKFENKMQHCPVCDTYFTGFHACSRPAEGRSQFTLDLSGAHDPEPAIVRQLQRIADALERIADKMEE